jgi:hypothetical protein
LSRLLVVLISLTFVVTTFASFETRAAADISAAETTDVLSTSGSVGPYLLPQALAECRYLADGSLEKVAPPSVQVQVKAHASHNTQWIQVKTWQYQRLANGFIDPIGPISGVQLIQVNTTTNTSVVIQPLQGIPTGPDWLLGVEIRWLASDNLTTEGSIVFVYSVYQPFRNGVSTGGTTNECGSPFLPPTAVLIPPSGTVNSTAFYAADRFPINVTVNVRWDGTLIASAYSGTDARVNAPFKVPAAPMGNHTVTFTYSHWKSSATFTVKPRIKVIPSTVGRGQTVNVSLRGFAAHESVRIRWKKGSSWVQIATVTTSSTGSANVNVKVPTFVPNGATSVRGDGTVAHAQTNAVTVSGGSPLTSSTVKTPTPTPTPTKTPTATATSTPIPNVTESPEATPTTPIEATPAATETATQIVETPSPEATETPLVETPAPTETATPEPTATDPADPTPAPSETPIEP